MNNILIQGKRHAGKTHLIGRLIDRYYRSRVAGFFTFRADDGIVYFREWDNALYEEKSLERIIYREDDKLVRYSVFEDYGVRAIGHAAESAQLMVFDELGRFEQDCTAFTAAIKNALSGPLPVLAALKSESNHFLDSLLNRSDCTVFSITQNNRERLFTSVSSILDPLLFM
jgi:nucleoside-triphosphatase THEP1